MKELKPLVAVIAALAIAKATHTGFCNARISASEDFMQLSVASNFDPLLVDALKEYPVHELYGKLASDVVGGGRSSYMLTPISKKKLEKHINHVRKNGMGFNYLLNAACLDNVETTRSGQKHIRALLSWISQIGATSCTVSNPMLLRMIKQDFPHLKVRVSVFAGVDHLQKAKYWEEIGADVICLDSLTVNREFKTLRSLRKNLKCELELLVNNSCLQSCSLSPAHMNLLAHSSQSKHKNGGFVIDHCILECSKMKMQNPVNYIRSDWIRPEDLHHYEDIGYQRFKIVERNLPTEIMLKRVKAYSAKSYNGNLIDLIQPYGHSETKEQSKKKIYRTLSFLLRPFKVNPLKLMPIKELSERKGMLGNLSGPSPVYIDNQKLTGFLERFTKNSCRDINCEDCLYCHKFAELTVSIDPKYKQDCLGLHQSIDKSLTTGDLWKY